MAPSSPNDELAELVLGALIEQGLIKPKRVEAVRAALKSGKVRPEDWSAWAGDFAREEPKDGVKSPD